MINFDGVDAEILDSCLASFSRKRKGSVGILGENKICHYKPAVATEHLDTRTVDEKPEGYLIVCLESRGYRNSGEILAEIHYSALCAVEGERMVSYIIFHQDLLSGNIRESDIDSICLFGINVEDDLTGAFAGSGKLI